MYIFCVSDIFLSICDCLNVKKYFKFCLIQILRRYTTRSPINFIELTLKRLHNSIKEEKWLSLWVNDYVDVLTSEASENGLHLASMITSIFISIDSHSIVALLQKLVSSLAVVPALYGVVSRNKSATLYRAR